MCSRGLFYCKFILRKVFSQEISKTRGHSSLSTKPFPICHFQSPAEVSNSGGILSSIPAWILSSCKEFIVFVRCIHVCDRPLPGWWFSADLWGPRWPHSLFLGHQVELCSSFPQEGENTCAASLYARSSSPQPPLQVGITSRLYFLPWWFLQLCACVVWLFLVTYALAYWYILWLFLFKNNMHCVFIEWIY